jgi:hypothetical protein
MPQTLDRLLLDSCLDVAVLDRMRADPEGELAAAGVPARLTRLVTLGSGSLISLAAITARPMPEPEAIVAAVRERAAGDPIFVEQLRSNPRHVVGRVLGRALADDAQVEVLDGEPLDLRLSGLVSVALPATAGDPITTVETTEEVAEEVVDEVVEEVVEVEIIVAAERFSNYWEPRREAWREEHAALLARTGR